MDLLRRGQPLRTAESILTSAAAIGAGIGDDDAIFPVPIQECIEQVASVAFRGYASSAASPHSLPAQATAESFG